MEAKISRTNIFAKIILECMLKCFNKPTSQFTAVAEFIK